MAADIQDKEWWKTDANPVNKTEITFVLLSSWEKLTCEKGMALISNGRTKWEKS